MAKRRGKGEGGLEERSGAFRAVLTLGKDLVTGKRRKLSETFRTKREASAWLREQLHKRDRGILGAPGAVTLGEWLQEWLALKADTVQGGSHDYYAQRVNLHLLPRIGGVRLRDLIPRTVDALYARLAADGIPAAERRKVAVTLNVALNDAVKRDLLPRNPANAVKKPKAPHVEVDPFKLEEALRFLAVARTKRLGAMYELAFDAGMRPGELFGLHWPEIDLGSGEVTVKYSLEERKGRFRLKEPKSRAGRRMIRISPATVAVLNRHRETMRHEARDVESGPVFLGVRGGWLSQPTVYRRVWLPILKQAGLRHFTPYATRHTMACLLLARGVNIKVVSRRLGHEDIQTTLRHYIHVMPDMEEQAVHVIQELFGGHSPQDAPK